ncbi:DEAD/DEAH box helicase [Vallicoccus soli]|uniref:DEAD/DEAH box helicase n=1 Tax=Vallicoccus soli TaxID=2339232 RepID=UPI001C49AE9B|nr:DEAD/DEAH box helicase [Vallicoccus soli]
MTSFRDLGVLDATAEALEAKGITSPFPIQAMTLPVALAGSDIIGQAKTGTGKTLGFGIPVVQRVVAPRDPDFDDLAAPGRPQALVVVPTRELCVQVTGDLELAGSRRGVRTLAVYGGRAYEPQVEALEKGVEVVVGTPGRLLDLAQQRKLDLSHVKVLVLDEADEMLDLGFLPDVERLIGLTPQNRQTMLFSATMPGAVVSLARRYLRQPLHIRASEPDDAGATVRSVRQLIYRAHAMDKVEMLARLLQGEGRGLTIVFCRTKRTAAKVADDLVARGFAAGAVHGDLGQGAREQALRAFRNGKVDVLVATDVAARGIDVQDVTHVVNFQCPEDEKTYLHRIGRTGRAGASGIAVTFVDWDDMPRWSLIDKALDLGLPTPEETYSTSPHLYADLDIPEGATGVLPRAQRTRAGLEAEEVEDLGETGKSAGRRQPARSAPPSRDDAPTDTEERERRPRRSRTRRRTRAGAPVEGEGTTAEGAPGAVGTTAPAGADPVAAREAVDAVDALDALDALDATDADAAAATDAAGEGEAPRRRRRRGGRGRGGAAGGGASGPGAEGADAAGSGTTA